MKEAIKCKLGIHKYEIYKEEEITDAFKNVIGKAFISRCAICGKLHTYKVYTVEKF